MTQEVACRRNAAARWPHSMLWPLVALVASGALVAAPVHGAALAEPRGTLGLPRGSGLATVDPASGAEQFVAFHPPSGVVGHVAWSPGGARVALSRFNRRPGERLGGSDILVADAAGGALQPAAEHDADGTLLRAPRWGPDGRGLFYDYLPPDSDPRGGRVEYAPLDGGPPRVAAAPAAWPDVSPDGRWLLYVRPSRPGGDVDELVLAPLDGSPGRVLVPGGQFVQLSSPRFSPDGRRVAFVAALTMGEARRLPPPSRDGLASVLAHGPPGDIWLVELNGSAPWQRTAFDEDEPTLAWAPDGAWLAMLGGGGLYLVDPDGRQPARLLRAGSFGGFDWR